ncbi:MAG: hypothetical protein LAT55_11090 [Opitutales bacterium]|nr:hypothetical protein [Opitutales bacterium]
MAKKVTVYYDPEQWESGLVRLVVCREKSDGMCEVGYFLVDSYCLGVKDAFIVRLSKSEFEQQLAEDPGIENPTECDPAWARAFIEGAVAYAKKLGFAPAKEYKKAIRAFGGIKASDCKEEFTYGKDGKPCFIGSPGEEVKNERILKKLSFRLGEGAFDFVLPEAFEDEFAHEDGFEAEGTAFFNMEIIGSEKFSKSLREKCEEMCHNVIKEDGLPTDTEMIFSSREEGFSAEFFSHLVRGLYQKSLEKGSFGKEENPLQIKRKALYNSAAFIIDMILARKNLHTKPENPDDEKIFQKDVDEFYAEEEIGTMVDQLFFDPFPHFKRQVIGFAIDPEWEDDGENMPPLALVFINNVQEEEEAQYPYDLE